MCGQGHPARTGCLSSCPASVQITLPLRLEMAVRGRDELPPPSTAHAPPSETSSARETAPRSDHETPHGRLQDSYSTELLMYRRVCVVGMMQTMSHLAYHPWSWILLSTTPALTPQMMESKQHPDLLAQIAGRICGCLLLDQIGHSGIGPRCGEDAHLRQQYDD